MLAGKVLVQQTRKYELGCVFRKRSASGLFGEDLVADYDFFATNLILQNVSD